MLSFVLVFFYFHKKYIACPLTFSSKDVLSRDRLYLPAISHRVVSSVIIFLTMEFGYTHIMVPLQEWNTIKKHVEILEKKGYEVTEISKNGCEVSEISSVVKCMMEAIDNDQPVSSISESDVQQFEEPCGVGDPVSETDPTANAASIPEMFKKHPMPPASPPPRKLLVKAHGPFANMVPPKDNRPWRSNGPYTKTSRSSTSSWDTSSWNSYEQWA